MIKPKKNIENLERMKDFGTDRSEFIRLDKNERTIPFPAKVYKSMLETIKDSHVPMYPDQTNLYTKLSKFLSIDNQNILLTSGSDAAIKAIFETYIDKGNKIIYLWPTYAMINVYAEMFEANKLKIGYTSDLELEFDSLINKIDCKTNHQDTDNKRCVNAPNARDIGKAFYNAQVNK